MKPASFFRYISARGNAGDALLAMAAGQFLSSMGRSDDGPVVYKPGGLSHHDNLLAPLRGLPRDTRILILPSSIDAKVARFLRQFPNLHLHCRGRDSLAIAEEHGISCELTEDLALGLDLSPWMREGDGVLSCFRTDLESATNYRPEDNRDISMEAEATWTPENCTEAADAFLRTIASHAVVETDRLHVAIAATLLGKEVTLYTGIDHKVREIFELSLSRFPNIRLRDAAETHRGIAPRAVIIHQSHRRDRYPAALRAALGNTRMQEAICPKWEATRENTAIRGCSLSHLHAVRMHGEGKPLLVLEDDAEILPGGYADWLAADSIPPDAGALLLGGDVEHFIPAAGHPGWYEVCGTYWGTQAVVYNLPALQGTDFMLNAYIYLAGNQMGPAGKGSGLCYESVLLMSLRSAGLKLYCRMDHAFTTRAALPSTRSGAAEPARHPSLTIQ